VTDLENLSYSLVRCIYHNNTTFSQMHSLWKQGGDIMRYCSNGFTQRPSSIPLCYMWKTMFIYFIIYGSNNFHIFGYTSLRLILYSKPENKSQHICIHIYKYTYIYTYTRAILHLGCRMRFYTQLPGSQPATSQPTQPAANEPTHPPTPLFFSAPVSRVTCPTRYPPYRPTPTR
jgi:hypothetical protein